jgi:hypothetical protein
MTLLEFIGCVTVGCFLCVANLLWAMLQHTEDK